jgi:hypothetical protein
VCNDHDAENRASALCAEDPGSNLTDQKHLILFDRYLSEDKPPRVSCQENPSKLDRSEPARRLNYRSCIFV